jgi:hypothetical protein
MLVRLFVVKEMQMDEFSGLVAFVITCILLGATYFSFQSILNECLLPLSERIFRKKQPSTPKPNQEDVPPTLTETILPEKEMAAPQYNDYRQAALQKVQEEQIRILDKVLHYTGQEFALYVEENEMQKLYGHIRSFQYATEKECRGIKTPVTVNSKLRPIDLMHFGRNIGYQFKKSGIEVATFIKQVFAEPLKEYEVSTLKRKLTSEGTCIIKLDKEL